MVRRCPDSTFITTSVLSDHALRFVGYSKVWQGGVATIHPTEGQRVYGAIYRLSPNDFRLLDRHEGGYRRITIGVEDRCGEPVDAQTYLHLEPEALCAPSPAYAAIIAHAHGRMGIGLGVLKQALLASAEG